MGSYELRRLVSYDDDSLVQEIQRVATLIPGEAITVAAFERLSKVDVGTLRRRFGGWREALAVAGLEHRFNDLNRNKSKEEIVAEIQRVASALGRGKLGRREFEKHARIKTRAAMTAFGSWRAALQAAGVSPTYIREPTESECFENLLSVWARYGRAPLYREMKVAPSKVSGKAYVRRWGSWMKALQAFVNAVEKDSKPIPVERQTNSPAKTAPSANAGPREPTLALRYNILRRDSFRCVLCGDSPATRVGCELHVDHINPYSKGGRTVLENLRTTCRDCNLGKGTKVETDV